MDSNVGDGSTRLITLRGGSGSGKSVVAAEIRAARPAGSVAIIGQDVIRREILSSGEDAGGHPIALIDLMARHLLDRGLDVIIEGILNADWYAETLTRLIADHRGVGRSYVWNLTFEETLRRHATKPVANAFGEAEMRTWWRGFQPITGLDEAVITADESLEATTIRIVRDCWPLAS
ncbi:AAA family ATPase [Microlunatus speluncae]|uniref:AAA family ATPase n=1 Tax=Microlunatus speluncae TaxID=2594267 RepID=UPI0012664A0C|nr:AAA family ATPase [Microlunatus speluncae]